MKRGAVCNIQNKMQHLVHWEGKLQFEVKKSVEAKECNSYVFFTTTKPSIGAKYSWVIVGCICKIFSMLNQIMSLAKQKRSNYKLRKYNWV